jgi:hypothetical protein
MSRRWCSLRGADGVVVGDGEAHEFGHFGHGGVDEFQVADGKRSVVGGVGLFDVAFGAVEQCRGSGVSDVPASADRPDYDVQGLVERGAGPL